MLVVRGWTPTVADAPPPPTGPVDVTGWLQPGEGSGVADPDPTDDVIPSCGSPTRSSTSTRTCTAAT